MPGFKSCFCRGSFSRFSHTKDLNFGTPAATLPGAWRYRVSAGTGRPSVSILRLGEIESLIFNFYLSVAARTTVRADLLLSYTSMLLGCKPNNKQPHKDPPHFPQLPTNPPTPTHPSLHPKQHPAEAAGCSPQCYIHTLYPQNNTLMGGSEIFWFY